MEKAPRIIFSPTPRAMSRTVKGWLRKNAPDRCGSDMLSTIMLGHHPTLAAQQQIVQYYADAPVIRFGIVRDPVERCASAYRMFAEKDESFPAFLPRWFHFAPTDEAMLDGLGAVFQFEKRVDFIFDRIKEMTLITAQNPPERKPREKKHVEVGISEKTRIRNHYAWTYDNFDYS